MPSNCIGGQKTSQYMRCEESDALLTPLMSSKAAEAHLLKTHFIGQASFDKYHVDILRSLCEKFELPVNSSGQRGKPIKKDYIAALHDFVRLD
jgi:hypothetical protein